MRNLDVIYQYDAVVTQLIQDIKKSDFKTSYFLKLLNLKDSFFYKKMREKRFTNEEVKLLSQHLYPEQYQEYKDELTERLLEKSKNQLENGEGVDFEKVLLKSQKQYGV